MTTTVATGPEKSITLPQGVRVTAPITPDFAEILTFDALALVAKPHRKFEPRRRRLDGRPDPC